MVIGIVFAREPEAPIGKRADRQRMVEDHDVAAPKTGAVEVPTSITRGPPDITAQGALDAAGLGALQNEGRSITSHGVDMAMKIRRGLYPRQIIIMVCTVP